MFNLKLIFIVFIFHSINLNTKVIYNIPYLNTFTLQSTISIVRHKKDLKILL